MSCAGLDVWSAPKLPGNRWLVDAGITISRPESAGCPLLLRLAVTASGPPVEFVEPVQQLAAPGDILLTIHVSPHPIFRRTGNRLDVRVPITLAEAALGAKIDVPTPHGTIALTVPPNTSSGKRLRIKGHGVRPASQPPGDLFAEVQIELPDGLTAEERQQLAEIANRYPHWPRAELKW
jgi:DnaJ-class molecular chaperone